MTSAAGTLYVVATPIGNLEDLSPRARRILGEVGLIAAEDTRTARKLLDACGLHVPLVSNHEHNEVQRVPQLIRELEGGKDVALISEAGMPGISDPGFRLVREAQERGVQVVGVPGPSAGLTALSISGLPTDRFLFIGFMPAKESRRLRALEALRREPGTLVVYESPKRIVSMLQDIHVSLPGREVAVGRELTKVFEEVLRGMPLDVVAQLEANEGERLRGEMTLLIAGAGRGGRRQSGGKEDLDPSLSLKGVARAVSRVLDVPSRDVYQALCRLKEQSPEE